MVEDVGECVDLRGGDDHRGVVRRESRRAWWESVMRNVVRDARVGAHELGQQREHLRLGEQQLLRCVLHA